MIIKNNWFKYKYWGLNKKTKTNITVAGGLLQIILMISVHFYDRSKCANNNNKKKKIIIK